jgi:hypothetical protein
MSEDSVRQTSEADKASSGGRIDPKPPEVVQNLVWLWRHGRQHVGVLIIAAIIFVIGLAVSVFGWERILNYIQCKLWPFECIWETPLSLRKTAIHAAAVTFITRRASR